MFVKGNAGIMFNMNLYEKYHSHRKIQKRIIESDDFTYNTLLFLLKKYLKKGNSVLDVGCGVGTVALYIGSLGHNVLGIDVSERGVGIAKQNASNLKVDNNVKFEKMDFAHSLPRQKFDAIVCTEVLEHLKSDKNAVSNMRSLLKRGGIVIASSPSLNAPLYKMGFLKKFDHKVGHLRRYNLQGFKKLFSDRGFRILEIKKTEGILRNLLFTNDVAGFLLKILMKIHLTGMISYLDDITIPLFGESGFYIVAKKYE